MPALICSAAELTDDVIVDLRAKSAPIQIKVEVLPCTSTERKNTQCLIEPGVFRGGGSVRSPPDAPLRARHAFIYIFDGSLGTRNNFYLFPADILICWALVEYITGGTELTLLFVKFIQGLCVRVCVCV